MSSKHVNIAAALTEMASRQPDTLAIAAPAKKGARPRDYHRWTYRQLDQASDQVARGLPDVGIQRGTRTAVMVRPGLNLFAITFGLLKLGAVPVMIDPGIGARNLGRCLTEAEPEAFIGIPLAHVARVLLGWGRTSMNALVTVGPRLGWGGTTLDKVMAAGRDRRTALCQTTADDLAAILFTSGSTGPPKGVIYRHGNFVAQVEAIRRMYGIQPGEVDLPTFPLFALFDPALGMSTIIPDMDPTRPARVDPRRLLPAIDEFGVSNMFGSPALLNTLGRYGEQHQVKIPGLKRVISAGAPVPIAVMRRLMKMLDDDAEVVTPYGATESLPVASISSAEIFSSPDIERKTQAGAGICVGRPVAEVELTITSIDDRTVDRIAPVAPGEIGEIVVQSAMTTRAYYKRPEATAQAKIELASGVVAHRMGDLGFVDEVGRLWYCGRKSHRVVTNSATLYSEPCELVFTAHPAVHRAALVGVQHEGTPLPVICIELEPGHSISEQELNALAKSQPHTSAIETFLFHPAFPVDIRHNSKIRREDLALWAEGRVR